MNIRNIGATPVVVANKIPKNKIISIPFELHCKTCGFHGDYVKLEHVFEYVMENMYDEVREAVSEQECDRHE